MSYQYALAIIILAIPLVASGILLIFPRLRLGPKWKVDQELEKFHKNLTTPAGHALAYLTALAGFMVFVPISILTLFLMGEMVGIVDNPSVHPVIFESTQNTLRSWLELCYFVASIIVAGVVWFAVRFARKQATEAENSRAAQVYLEITGRYISGNIAKSRAMVVTLRRQFDPDAEPRLPLGEFIHEQIEPLRSSNIDDFEVYMKYIELLTFFEDVGVLVKRGYVKSEDIKLLFKAAILGVRDLFAHHIEIRQAEEGDPQMFENFLELCKEMEAC
jgi:hypothetical protein